MIILKLIQYVKNGKVIQYLKEATLKKEGTYIILDLENKHYFIINDKKHIPIDTYNELMEFIDQKGLELL